MVLKDKLHLYEKKEELKNLLKGIYNPRLSNNLKKSLKMIDSEILKDDLYFQNIMKKDLKEVSIDEISNFYIFFMNDDTHPQTYKYLSNSLVDCILVHNSGTKISFQIKILNDRLTNLDGFEIDLLNKNIFIKTTFNIYEYYTLNEKLDESLKNHIRSFKYDAFNFWSEYFEYIYEQFPDKIGIINFGSNLNEDQMNRLKSKSAINKFNLHG